MLTGVFTKDSGKIMIGLRVPLPSLRMCTQDSSKTIKCMEKVVLTGNLGLATVVTGLRENVQDRALCAMQMVLFMRVGL